MTAEKIEVKILEATHLSHGI